MLKDSLSRTSLHFGQHSGHFPADIVRVFVVDLITEIYEDQLRLRVVGGG